MTKYIYFISFLIEDSSGDIYAHNKEWALPEKITSLKPIKAFEDAHFKGISQEVRNLNHNRHICSVKVINYQLLRVEE